MKSTSVSIGTAVKKLGKYDYNKLELINVVVTDKALVHHFRYEDKKNKKVIEIATFITHHNFLCYAVELGSIPYATLKDERFGNWEYVGFTGDQIFFAARDYQNKERGWSVKEYSSKGKQKVGLHFNSPENLIPIENIGFGTTGSYYLEDKATVESGLLVFINSKFYLIGGQRKDAGAEITLYELIENEWEELSNMHLNYFIEKKNLKLGVYPMNEGVGYHLNHNGYNKTSILYFEKKADAPHNDFTRRTIFNPSSVFDRKKKEEFNVILPEGLLNFNTQQLGKKGNVKLVKRRYSKRYLKGNQIVIVTTDVPRVNINVYKHCRKRGILVNVADNPPYCDFYMGGIVTKGNVKVAISTNGQSPTMAKRLRQYFEDVIPENIDDLVKNLNLYRKTIKGNFEQKVEVLNEFTKGIVQNKTS